MTIEEIEYFSNKQRVIMENTAAEIDMLSKLLIEYCYRYNLNVKKQNIFFEPGNVKAGFKFDDKTLMYIKVKKTESGMFEYSLSYDDLNDDTAYSVWNIYTGRSLKQFQEAFEEFIKRRKQ